MTATSTDIAGSTVRRPRIREDGRRIVFAYGAMVLVFVVGGLLNPAFFGGASIRANLVVASFIGLVAAGQAFVILVGGIDLSIPWVLNGAMVLTVTTSTGSDDRAALTVAVVLGFGLLVGLLNGLGIAYLAVPAVVMTLGMNGIMEGLTLGFSGGLTCGSCSASAPPVLRALYTESVLGVPYGLILWAAITAVIFFVLSRTTFGRRVYAVGNSPRASFLSGVDVRRVTVVLYMLSGMFAALTGMVLASFGGTAALAVGDPFLFLSIAAVVVGGLSILGGRGHYLGVVAGAITLALLTSLLRGQSWLQESDRNILYGVAIIGILLLYGRSKKEG